MENKQTALMWLESKLNSVKPTDFCSIETIKDWVNQAKAMEKEHIKDAWKDSNYHRTSEDVLEYSSNEYYEETYGTQLPKE